MQKTRVLMVAFGWLLASLLLPLTPVRAAETHRIALFIPEYTAFWTRLSGFARAAADDLGVQLTVYEAGRPRGPGQPRRMLEQVDQALARGVDGILFYNFMGIGEQILRRSQAAGVPAILINTALDDPSLRPRAQYPLWIGSILPDEREAGLRLANALIDEARARGHQQFNIFAFAGGREARSHRLRLEALQALAEARDDVNLVDIRSNTTDGEGAAGQLLNALREHPQTNVVWGYKDLIVLEAARALRADPPAGIDPGQIMFGGIDWNPDALRAIRDGIIDIDLGGHVFDAAQGVIMMTDYLDGRDFAEEALQWPSSMFVARRDNVDRLLGILEDPKNIDYRQLSKTFNPDRRQYRFDLDALTRARARKPFQLSEQQQDWLKQHSRIRIGAMNDWPPFDFLDENGQPAGIGADLVRELNRLLDQRLTLVSGPWTEIYEKTRSGELDALLDITPKPSREKDFLFTRLYQDVPHVIVARRDSPFLASETDLAGKRLALERGFGNVEYFRREYPSVQLELYPDTLAALEAVSRGDADAYAGNRVVSLYLIDKEDLSNLRVHGRLNKSGSRLAIGVPRSQPVLRDILDRALQHIGEQGIADIAQKWIRGDEANEEALPPPLPLTDRERAWLRSHPRIRLAIDSNWKPMEFIDADGRYQGLSSEFIRYFERQLGIRFEAPPRLPWPRVVENLQQRKLDLAPMLLRTEQRERYLGFTRPYLKFPVVIFTRQQDTLLNGLKELDGRRVGVVRGYAISELLERDHPGIRQVMFDDNLSGFQALALGQIDAFVDLLATGAYLIADQGLSNIQVAALTPYGHDFSMGVRSDWPELVSILDKAIAALPEQKKDAFIRKWLTVKFQQKVDYELIIWVILIALIVIGLLAFRAWEMSRVNSQLEESRRRLSLSLRGAQLGTWEMRHSEKDGEMLEWDEDFARQHGLPWPGREQPLQRFLDSIDSEFRSSVRRAIHECLDGIRDELRIEYACNQGRNWIFSQGQIFERGERNRPLRIVGISQDITERIEASRALQRSSEFKSQFLANMSHEIRTPMNAIVGLGHLLSRTELSTRQAGYVQHLQSSAQSLLSLVNDILDFSKIEAGHLDIDRIEFDLEELLADLARLNALRIGDKPVEFLYDIGPDVPVQLLGDPFRINQVLTNLVSNAIKFTEQGSIILRVSRIGGDDEQARLRFEVSDTGIGIEAAALERLFDAFVQADGSTTRRFGGTGLGLSISKQLVELMGGEIHVDSEPGKGSRFWFELPFGLATGRCARYLPSNGNLDLRDLRVLLVDDNETALQILGSMLQSMSFRVTAVDSGEKALQALQDQEFDLVLLDWRMPRMTGDQLSAEIRRRLPRSRLPIIIMITAYGREADEQMLDLRQLDGFLVKPITPSQLFNAIIMARHALDDAPASPPTKPAPDSQAMRPLKGRVMLAEDNPINQQVASELLQQMGLEVVICNNGREVLERLDEARPDLILMDIQMPELDGYETTRRLRENPAWKELPILAMTANAMADDVRKALQLGMNAHIAKPVNPELLHRTLSRFLPAADERPQPLSGDDAGEEESAWPDRAPGLDIRSGIRQVGGNARLYRKLLMDFLGSYHQAAGQLEDLLAAGDPDSAERLTHTLKGVAANVGATRLADRAARLDEALRQGITPPREEIAEFAEALDEVCNSLRQLQRELPSGRPADSLPEARIDQLQQALGNADSRSRQLFQTLQPVLEQTIGADRCRQLQALIDDYEFDAALELLENTTPS
jgi:two-component system sensor histidine kinase/response regulator